MKGRVGLGLKLTRQGFMALGLIGASASGFRALGRFGVFGLRASGSRVMDFLVVHARIFAIVNVSQVSTPKKPRNARVGLCSAASCHGSL